MQTIDLRNAAAVGELFEQTARCLRNHPDRRGCCVNLPPRGRLLATGDLHDNPLHLQKIIRAARLNESPEHHLTLHEMIHGEHLINGTDLSHRMLARVAQLIVQYPHQVHPLLANHELSQMTNRGVSKGAGNTVELFKDGLDYVFGDAASDVERAIDDFIRAFPLALRSEGGVLCAHSLPAARTMDRFDPDIFDRELTDNDYDPTRGSAYLMIWGREHTPEQIERLAEHWNVRLFVLGHQHVETGIETRGRRVVILNSDHERATVLPIDLAAVPDAAEAIMHSLPLAAINA